MSFSYKAIIHKFFTVVMATMLLLAAMPVKPAFAAACTFTSTGNGNWTTGATWNRVGVACSTYPGQTFAGDTVLITGQSTVTLNVANPLALNSIQINSDNNGGACGINVGANTLTVTNGITFNANNNGGICQISVANGQLAGASVTINGGNPSSSQINITGSGTVNISGAVSMTAPTGGNPTDQIAVGAGTFNAGSLSLIGGTGTRVSQVTLSTGTVNVSGNITFGGTAANARLVYTGAGVVNVGGNLGAGGTFTASTGIINFNGSGAQTAGGVYTYNIFKVNNNSVSGVTLGGNSTITTLTVGDVTANSLFNDGGFTLTSAGTLNLTSGTFKLGTAATATVFPGFTTRNINAGTTVEYGAGVAQTVSIVPNYSNLVFSGAGVKTTQAGTLTIGSNWTVGGGNAALNTNNTAVNLTGNLNLNSGTLIQGNGAINIGGNWTNNSTFTAGSGGVIFNGSLAQIIGGTSATTFNNLTINNANGVSLSGINTTVNGILNFISGKIATGVNKVIIGTAGSITGAGVGKYVYGNLQKNFLTGVQSFSFEVGDAAIYAPVLVSFANVSTAGNVTASTTGSDHAQISNSSIDPAKDANRFWTLTPGGGLAFSTYNATFNFVPGDLDTGADTTNFIVQLFSSGTWSSPSVGTLTSTSSQATGLVAANFGDFSVGEKAKATTTVSCVPNPVIVFSGSLCTATVTRVSGSTTPGGTISWSTNGSGSFTPAVTCILSGSGAFSTCSVTYTPSAVGTGSHLITASYGGNLNFKSSNGSQTLIVNKANATIVVTPYSVTYDGNAHTATGSATGMNAEDLSSDLDLTATTHTNAGTYNGDAWTFTDSTGNYNDANGTVDDAIGKANATIVVTPYSVTYDGNAHTATGSATGVIAEDLSSDLDLTATTHTNAGTYNGDAWTFTDSTGNYNDANGTVDNVISKANATIVVTPYSVTYDGNAHTATGSATGVTAEDLSSDLDLTGTTHTNAGTYNGDAWTFTDSTGNYNDANGTVDDVIGKANAVIVVTPYNVTYDGNAHTATGSATGVNAEDLSSDLDLTATTHTNAGTYNGDAWTFTDSTGNYNDANGTVDDVIGKANAVIVVTPYNVTYDGNAHTATGSATGVNAEDLSSDLDLTATTHTNAGTYNGDAWTFTDSTGNYNDANGTVDDVIGKANAVIVVTPYNVTYDGNAHTATGSATGVTAEDLSSDLDLTATTHTNAGTYNGDAWTFTDSTGNYNDANGTVDDAIGSKVASVTPNATGKTYGAADPALTGTLTGFLAADNVTATYSRTAGETVAGSPYTISAVLAPAGVLGNYNITYNTADFTISQKAASVTPNATGKTYGAADPALTGTLTGFLAADNVTATYSRTAGETVAGSPYTISAVLAPAGVLGNYNITYNTADFTISQKDASVTPDASGKIYGAADPALTGTLTGFLVADNVTATYSRTTGETVAGSPYTISAVLAPAGVLGNYNITYNTANFTITQFTATVTLGNLNHTYDGTQKSAAAITTPPGLTVVLTYTGISGTTYPASTTPPINAGSYNVDAVINDPDYIGFTNDTLTIAQATVNPAITANNKIYDDTTAATIASRSLSGVFGVDDVLLSGGTATFADPNVGTWTVTATGLSLSGTDIANYQLSSTTATTSADITQRTLTVTATGVNKTYDGTTAATVTLSDDRLAGDIVNTSYTTAAFSNPNVGTWTVSVSGISISGGVDAGNYTLGNITTTTTANITNLGQTITVTIPAPSSASNGSSFNVAATASSGLPVTITTSGVCSGGDIDGTATITMTSSSGVCNIFYDQAGDVNYSAAPQVQENTNATQGPAITSADNITFDINIPGTFTVTTTGNPATPMTITKTGSLPTGVTFVNNNDGTATLSGTPPPGTEGVYNLVITADNGVLPNATQNFTLTVKNGPGVNKVNSIPDTGDGSISENETISTSLNLAKITINFTQNVNNPVGDTDPKDVTNPANYILVRGSTSGAFQTVSCKGGVVTPDFPITVDSVTYSNGGGNGPFMATLTINSGLPVNVAGYYRLYVCGTTSIVDALNTDLALAGNGTTPGTDFLRNFRMQDPIPPNNGGGNPPPTVGNVLIPVTGFAPNQVTQLSAKTAQNSYSSSEMLLDIPSLSLKMPIVGVTLTKEGWDVSRLGNNAGYLEGSAYPTWMGNTILTGHVTDVNGKPGPFAYIHELKVGDKFYIHNNGFTYVYEVRQSKLILPISIKTLFKHEDYDWVTLITCENYDQTMGRFIYRRMVNAALISTIPEK